MLSVNINQDVEKYKEGVIGTFDAKQSASIFVAGVLGVGSICLFHFAFGINLMIACYISLIFIVPVIVIGFGKKDGLSVIQRIQRIIQIRKIPLLYEATYINYENEETKNVEEKKGFKIFKNVKK